MRISVRSAGRNRGKRSPHSISTMASRSNNSSSPRVANSRGSSRRYRSTWYTRPFPYSWIRLKVGLETSSAAAAPSPLTIPFASVVLPAPRLPVSSTTPCAGSARASRSPRAMVSSSDAVRYVGTLLHGVRKISQNVGGDEAFLPHRPRADLAREPVQVNRGGHRLVRLTGKLRQEAGDHAHQQVAASAGAQRGRARGIDPHAAVGEGNHRALAFENQGNAAVGGEGAGGAHTVAL